MIQSLTDTITKIVNEAGMWDIAPALAEEIIAKHLEEGSEALIKTMRAATTKVELSLQAASTLERLATNAGISKEEYILGLCRQAVNAQPEAKVTTKRPRNFPSAPQMVKLLIDGWVNGDGKDLTIDKDGIMARWPDAATAHKVRHVLELLVAAEVDGKKAGTKVGKLFVFDKDLVKKADAKPIDEMMAPAEKFFTSPAIHTPAGLAFPTCPPSVASQAPSTPPAVAKA